MSITERVERLDVSLFDYVESQTTPNDRRSLLALQNVAAGRAQAGYVYLEIGSYLGGSLQAVVADQRCRRIVSIDSRPAIAPDERGNSGYPHNSSSHMLELLTHVPGADIGKIEVVEQSVEELDPAALPRPDLVLIDGEHTLRAVLRDARFCLAACRGAGIIAFHDFTVVGDSILDFLEETPRSEGLLLRDDIFVVNVAAKSLLVEGVIRQQLRGPTPVWKTANRVRGVRVLMAPRHLVRLRA